MGQRKYLTGRRRHRPHRLEDGTILLVLQVEVEQRWNSFYNQEFAWRDASVEDVTEDAGRFDGPAIPAEQVCL